jgi:hypothetical protein
MPEELRFAIRELVFGERDVASMLALVATCRAEWEHPQWRRHVRAPGRRHFLHYAMRGGHAALVRWSLTERYPGRGVTMDDLLEAARAGHAALLLEFGEAAGYDERFGYDERADLVIAMLECSHVAAACRVFSQWHASLSPLSLEGAVPWATLAELQQLHAAGFLVNMRTLSVAFRRRPNEHAMHQWLESVLPQ